MKEKTEKSNCRQQSADLPAILTDACWDREGKQYVMPEIGKADLKVIEELFVASVFMMLLEENMISEELVEKMSSWKHSGLTNRKSPLIAIIIVTIPSSIRKGNPSPSISTMEVHSAPPSLIIAIQFMFCGPNDPPTILELHPVYIAKPALNNSSSSTSVGIRQSF